MYLCTLANDSVRLIDLGSLDQENTTL